MRLNETQLIALCLILTIVCLASIIHQHVTKMVTSNSVSKQPFTRDRGATGVLFSGVTVRTYTGEWKLQETISFHPQSDLKARFVHDKSVNKCRKWAVVTTIFAPSEAVQAVSRLNEWCMVIVGDMQTPSDYLTLAGLDSRPDVIFLSIDVQREIIDDFVPLVPFKSFARKNIGYLYAIHHGAEIVFDFDDDNILKPLDGSMPVPPLSSAWPGQVNATMNVRFLVSNVTTRIAFNPLPLMKPSISGPCWPRGFPLEYIKETAMHNAESDIELGTIAMGSVGVIQIMADKDPDVDAVYRLTRPLPISFDDTRGSSLNLLVPHDTYASYNAQASLHMYGAFWGLLLPTTVPGRVSDIWRAYFAQRIMKDLGLRLIYSPPKVVQIRNSHNYIADMDAEHDLYMKTANLLRFLDSWETQSSSLPAEIERLWVALYERDYIGLADVKILQEWLLALSKAGYIFPTIQSYSTQQNMQPRERRQHVMHEQIYDAGPVFNLGGSTKIPYQHEDEHSDESWKQWLQENILLPKPDHTVLKIVLMTRNEWPLIKTWTLYHGKMLGFENLYILDDSTDERCRQFLIHARDALGVNLIFSPANLNEVVVEINTIFINIAPSSDMIIKLDTDEFLALYANDTLDPFAVTTYLQQSRGKLDGRKLKIGFVAGTVAMRNLCDKTDSPDITLFPQSKPEPTTFKSFFDSRTFSSVDLGSHDGDVLAPFSEVPCSESMLSIIHTHNGCFDREVLNNKQAVERHQYVFETDSDDDAIKKMEALLRLSGQDLCDGKSGRSGFSSVHKVEFYLKYLICQNKTRDEYYANTGEHWHNNLFEKYVQDAYHLFQI